MITHLNQIRECCLEVKLHCQVTRMGMISELVTETKNTRHIFKMSLHLSPAQPSSRWCLAHQLLSPARPGRVFAPRTAEAVLPGRSLWEKSVIVTYFSPIKQKPPGLRQKTTQHLFIPCLKCSQVHGELSIETRDCL